MRILNIGVEEVALDLVDGYRIAGHAIDTATNFIVRIETDAGVTGLGCAAPAAEVTGETTDACREALTATLARYLDGAAVDEDPSALALGALDVATGTPAACAAIDMALWDIAAIAAGRPLCRHLGGAGGGRATSVTIGICDSDETVARAQAYLADGFSILKVKAGDDVDADVETISRLREAVGAEAGIRIDANQGYTLAEARRFLAATAGLALELIEQPLTRDALEDAAALTRESTIPVIADESAVSVEDCRRVIAARAAHGINIKLMKCGGISVARQIQTLAEGAGFTLMIGCNDESRISIAAGLHFALATPAVRYVDLDGHLDLAHDPAQGGFTVRRGRLQTTAENGLGTCLG